MALTEALMAASILKKAVALVTGDRQKEYGDKSTNFGNTAALWNAYLRNNYTLHQDLTPHDVAMLMILLKMSRTQSGGEAAFKEDTYVDIAGYASIAAVLASGKKVLSKIMAKVK